MNLLSSSIMLSAEQTLQYVALFLATIEFILALYVLFLNPFLSANRHVSVLLFLGALTSLAQGLLIGATSLDAVYLPTLILSAAVGPIQVLLLITAVVLIKPSWMPGSSRARGWGRWRWAWYLVYALAFAPLVLTLIDVLSGTQFWYTGVDPATYTGGYVSSVDYTSGSLSPPLKIILFQVFPLLVFVPLLFVALRDKEATPLDRRLAWVLFGQQVVVLIFAVGLRDILPAPLPDLVTTLVFVLGYAYVVFQQMAAGRRLQRGRLRPRMTALVLVVAIPLLIAVALLVSLQASAELEGDASDQLVAANRALSANVSVWVDSNVRALQQLVILPDILSMDAAGQRPVLQAMATAYPYMYLVSTTDLNGINIARNDDEDPKDYSDRVWVQEPIAGSPLTFQSLIGRTSGQPALVVSMPIKDPSGEIIGVGMFAANLTELAGEVEASRIGDTGFAYVVDAGNKVIAHPDPAFVQTEDLVDMSDAPPVAALRQGTRGLVAFTDGAGERWLASVDELANGWGVVIQQPVAELSAARQAFQGVSWLLIAAGSLVLLVMTWLTISQVLRPIDSLTQTAESIAAGDLTATASIESEDEIGVLAETFNDMTGQIRDLIGGLEQRIAERTQDLERRTRYLAATAQVGRAVAVILETDQLIQDVVELIRVQFGLYYVGLFLLDEAEEWAVLQAGTGDAGRAMLARKHRIRVGEGMIGWSVERGESRVALDVGEDAVRLATTELPETRSEAALPLRSRGRVLGALTVQHTQPGAFDEDTLVVLQTMADQVAVAISNAQLFQQVETALAAERRVYGEISAEAWEELLRARPGLGYRADEQGVSPVGMPGAVRESGRASSDGKELVLPIKLQDQVLGTFHAHKADDSEEWTEDEVALIETLNDQLSLALESARLYGETQRRAFRDRMLGEVTSQSHA